MGEEIKNLELIIDDLAAGREECEISDPQNTLEDALEFLRDYLQELKDLDQQIAENGNTPEMLKAVHDKYSELWVFQLMCTVQSLPRVIGPLISHGKWACICFRIDKAVADSCNVLAICPSDRSR